MYRSPFRTKARCTCTFKKPGSWSAGYHTGEDWVSDSDRTLVSPADGTVVRAKFDNDYGFYVIIRTTDNNSILMAHMADKPAVILGQQVKAGDVVGKMGSTGHSSGAHLHIEVQAANVWAYNKNLRKPSLYIDFNNWGDEVKKQIKIKLNGKLKTVTAIESEGNNYVRLQDLRDSLIDIGYDNIAKLPTISAK